MVQNPTVRVNSSAHSSDYGGRAEIKPAQHDEGQEIDDCQHGQNDPWPGQIFAQRRDKFHRRVRHQFLVIRNISFQQHSGQGYSRAGRQGGEVLPPGFPMLEDFPEPATQKRGCRHETRADVENRTAPAHDSQPPPTRPGRMQVRAGTWPGMRKQQHEKLRMETRKGVFPCEGQNHHRCQRPPQEKPASVCFQVARHEPTRTARSSWAVQDRGVQNHFQLRVPLAVQKQHHQPVKSG